MAKWMRRFAWLWLACASAGALAGGEVFDGCVDKQGMPVESVADEALPVVARAQAGKGIARVTHNPTLLPKLSTRARMFFYAHECARIALGHPLAGERSAARAHEADCYAAAVLQQSGQLDGAAGVAALQGELAMAEEDWRQLPGPARSIELASCANARGAMRVPVYAPASDAQMRADRCAHACGDRSWHCQRGCRDGACKAQCEAGYLRCEAGCGKP